MMNKFLTVALIFVSSLGYAAGYLEFDDNGNPYKWDDDANPNIDWILEILDRS
ncbi:MAG: hypothetical protein R2877_03605 [Bdellovibrionota bacterium]